MNVGPADGRVCDMDDGVVGIGDGGLGDNSELYISCTHPLGCFHLFCGMRFVCGVRDGAASVSLTVDSCGRNRYDLRIVVILIADQQECLLGRYLLFVEAALG